MCSKVGGSILGKFTRVGFKEGRSRNLLKKILIVAQAVLAFSAVMDLILWVFEGYLIPCYVVSVFSVGSILFIEAIKRLTS